MRVQDGALNGQSALVTGGNSGIGKASVRALAAAGATVAINYVSHSDAAETLVKEIEKNGGRALAVRADVSREEDVERMFERVRQELGTLHILVANAGIQNDAPLLEMSLDAWNEVLGVNLTGAFLCVRAAAREFVRRGVDPSVSRAAGKIILMSSVHQMIPWSGHVNYAASKGGILQLMRTSAQELARHGIRVNGVAPGAIKTPINEPAWSTPDAEAQLLRLIPYGRVGDPEDIGRAVAWLASDASDYVQGATLFVDGGMSLFPGFSTGSG